MEKQYSVIYEIKQVTKFYLVEVEPPETSEYPLRSHSRWGTSTYNDIPEELKQKFINKKRRYVGKKEEDPDKAFEGGSGRYREYYSLNKYCGTCGDRLKYQYSEYYWCARCQENLSDNFRNFQLFTNSIGSEESMLEEIEEYGEVKGFLSRYNKRKKHQREVKRQLQSWKRQ